MVYPRSVASPTFVISHHIVCLMGWMLIILSGEHKFVDVPSEILVVEINTWIMTSRRHVDSNGLLHRLLNATFYGSWVLIRNVFYPFKLVSLVLRYIDHSVEKGSYVNWTCSYVVVVAVLNALNTKWTFDLFFKPPVTIQKDNHAVNRRKNK